MKKLTVKFWRFWYFVRRIVWKTPAPFITYYTNDLPDEIETNSVYLVGENGTFWVAALECPCGCGDLIQLNLLPEVKPRWHVEEHSDGTVSLSPSIWSRKKCGSHYFLKNGCIKWHLE